MSRSVGPVTFLGGRTTSAGARRFAATLAGVTTDVEVRVDGSDVMITVEDAELPEDVRSGFEVDPPFGVPLGGHIEDGEAHVALTLPQRQDAGWSTVHANADEISLAIGGLGQLGDIGATIDASCGAHGDSICVRCPSEAVGTLAALGILLRLRPILTSFDFDADMPWTPPKVALGRVGSGGATGDYATEDIYAALKEAVADAVRLAGAPIVEYGVVEHVFAFNEPLLYRSVYERAGHIAVDQPMSTSMSGYLGGRLGQLSRWDSLRYRSGPGTAYWSYNHRISYWGLPGGADGPACSWETFAEDIVGCSPDEIPAAQLIWGADVVLERDWTGWQGPGETEALDSSTVPATTDDESYPAFAGRFDAAAAFGVDLMPMLARVRRQLEDLPSELAPTRAMPKDVGMLRGIMAATQPDDPLAAAALWRLREVSRR